MKRLLLWLIDAYRRWISPALPQRCKYYPTCSSYAAEAVKELGPLRGSIVAGWRLLRCNPLSDGGIDELEDRTLFRSSNGGSSPSAPGPAGRQACGGDAEAPRGGSGEVPA